MSAVVLYDNVYECEMAKRNDWQHVHLCKSKFGILGAILGLPEWYSSREWQWMMLRNLTPFVGIAMGASISILWSRSQTPF